MGGGEAYNTGRMAVVTYSLLPLALIKISKVGGSQHWDGRMARRREYVLLCNRRWRLPCQHCFHCQLQWIVNNVSDSTTCGVDGRSRFGMEVAAVVG